MPVLNRLIAGGGFSSGTVAGDGDSTGSEVRAFDMNQTKSGEGNLIDQESHLVFPVRIMFADDSVTRREGEYESYASVDGKQYTKSGSTATEVEVLKNGEISPDGLKVMAYFGDDDFSENSASGTYVKIGASMYMLKTDLDVDKTHTTPNNNAVSFQMNIIFAKSRPNASGAMFEGYIVSGHRYHGE